MGKTSANARFLLGDAGHFLAFGLGAGLTPKAPGTAGTLLAFPLYWAVIDWSPSARWLLAVVLFAVGVWLCGRACRALGKHDDSGVVLDEIVAFYAVLLALPAGALWQAAGFALFRVLDSYKPQPLRWLDNNIGGGFGIMLDDAVAALFTVFLLALVAAVI